MRKRRFLNAHNLVGLAILAVMLLGCFLFAGGIGVVEGMTMIYSPKFSESALRGLTRDEVFQRLGKPSYDPAWIDSAGRSTTTRPWDEATDGPYTLGYFRGFGTCAIRFENGRVKTVTHSMK